MTRIFLLLAAVAVALSVAVFTVMVRVSASDQTPPILGFGKVETLNSPIKPGEKLLVRIWREKARGDCPVESRRNAVNNDGVVFDMPNGESAGGAVDAPFIEFSYPTLRSMPDGDYRLRVSLTYTCPGGVHFDYEQPTAFFRVRRE